MTSVETIKENLTEGSQAVDKPAGITNNLTAYANAVAGWLASKQQEKQAVATNTNAALDQAKSAVPASSEKPADISPPPSNPAPAPATVQPAPLPAKALTFEEFLKQNYPDPTSTDNAFKIAVAGLHYFFGYKLGGMFGEVGSKISQWFKGWNRNAPATASTSQNPESQTQQAAIEFTSLLSGRTVNDLIGREIKLPDATSAKVEVTTEGITVAIGGGKFQVQSVSTTTNELPGTPITNFGFVPNALVINGGSVICRRENGNVTIDIGGALETAGKGAVITINEVELLKQISSASTGDGQTITITIDADHMPKPKTAVGTVVTSVMGLFGSTPSPNADQPSKKKYVITLDRKQ